MKLGVDNGTKSTRTFPMESQVVQVKKYIPDSTIDGRMSVMLLYVTLPSFRTPHTLHHTPDTRFIKCCTRKELPPFRLEKLIPRVYKLLIFHSLTYTHTQTLFGENFCLFNYFIHQTSNSLQL